MVAGQQVNGHRHGSHGLQRAPHRLRRHEIGVEHVARDHDELGAGTLGELPDGADRVDAGSGVPGLRLTLEEVPGHAQVPVAGMHEADHRHLPCKLAGRRVATECVVRCLRH